MTDPLECSPYLSLKRRSLREVERKIGIVRGLTEEERTMIREGNGMTCEGFCGFYTEMVSAGAHEDKRAHLRTFFGLLRDQIQRHADIGKALEAVDYEDTPAERGYWQDCGRADRAHLASVRQAVRNSQL